MTKKNKQKPQLFPDANFRNFARHVIATGVANVSVFFFLSLIARAFRAQKIFITERARVRETRKNLRVLKSSEKKKSHRISAQIGSPFLSLIDIESRGFAAVGSKVSDLIAINSINNSEISASRLLHNRIISSRNYSSLSLSHLDVEGREKMLEIGAENVTNRKSETRGFFNEFIAINNINNSEIRVSRLLHNRIISRNYSSSTLSHVDVEGKAKMVDVGDKNVTTRKAEARGFVFVGPKVAELIAENNMKKGDVLVVAQLAGIMAAKRTAELIPLCHPLSLNCVNVNVKLNPELHRVEITSEVRCTGKTGVEMEALTAVSVAALTVHDMCKAVAPPSVLRISGIEVTSKSGGRSGNFSRDDIDNAT